jgi:hypothetical protein
MSHEERIRKTTQNIAINDRLIRESKARLESISNQLLKLKNHVPVSK